VKDKKLFDMCRISLFNDFKLNEMLFTSFSVRFHNKREIMGYFYLFFTFKGDAMAY